MSIGVVSVVRKLQTSESASRCERKAVRSAGSMLAVGAYDAVFWAASQTGRSITHLRDIYLTEYEHNAANLCAAANPASAPRLHPRPGVAQLGLLGGVRLYEIMTRVLAVACA
jgi:hypothetical protein